MDVYGGTTKRTSMSYKLEENLGSPKLAPVRNPKSPHTQGTRHWRDSKTPKSTRFKTEQHSVQDENSRHSQQWHQSRQAITPTSATLQKHTGFFASDIASPSHKQNIESGYWPTFSEEQDNVEKLPDKEINDLTVMVVDDAAVLLSLYARMLKNANVTHVFCVESGEACLATLFGKNSQHVDVIFMDDQMPGLRGPYTAHEVRVRCNALRIPVPSIYLCTGSSPQQLRDEFPQLDKLVKAVLQKPLTFEHLKTILQAESSEEEKTFSVQEPASGKLGLFTNSGLYKSFNTPMFDVDVGSLLANQLQFEQIKKELDEMEEKNNETASQHSVFIKTDSDVILRASTRKNTYHSTKVMELSPTHNQLNV